MSQPTRYELLSVAAFAIAHGNEQVAIARMRDVTVETKRASKRSRKNEVERVVRPAEATLHVSDEVIRSLRGNPDMGSEVLVLVIPKAVREAFADREYTKRTGVVLP